jgi:hypothetical protein
MLIATRAVASTLAVLCVAWGWPVLVSAGAGYLGVAVPAVLAARGAAWFGDEFDDVIGLGPDRLIRGFGLVFLVVLGAIAAELRWQWFA